MFPEIAQAIYYLAFFLHHNNYLFSYSSPTDFVTRIFTLYSLFCWLKILIQVPKDQMHTSSLFPKCCSLGVKYWKESFTEKRLKIYCGRVGPECIFSRVSAKNKWPYLYRKYWSSETNLCRQLQRQIELKFQPTTFVNQSFVLHWSLADHLATRRYFQAAISVIS